jgi:hypothetical protein
MVSARYTYSEKVQKIRAAITAALDVPIKKYLD